MIGAAFLVTFGLAAAADDCPALLVLRDKEMAAGDVATAQTYADCIRIPWRSAEPGALAQRTALCRSQLPAAADKSLAGALAWVDKMTANFTSCETRLEIEKK